MLHHLIMSSFFVTLCTAVLRAPLSMGFSRQKYWSGLPFPPPGDLPDPGIKPMAPVTTVLASGIFATVPPGKPIVISAQSQINREACGLPGILKCCVFRWLHVDAMQGGMFPLRAHLPGFLSLQERRQRRGKCIKLENIYIAPNCPV